MPQHRETRDLPYKADQIYELVADIAAYPEFLPWCAAARVRSTKREGVGTRIAADLVIAFKLFRERFGSDVFCDPVAKQIDVAYLDGPFKYLTSSWKIDDTQTGCQVTFEVDFEFKNKVLQGVIGLVFYQAMQRIVQAFEDRAAALYGPAN